MVDQVSPTGSLAAGLAQVSVPAGRTPGLPDTPRAAKIAGLPSPEPDGQHLSGNSDAAAKEINSYLQGSKADLKMEVDAATGRAIYQVVSSTGEVLLQMPSKEVLAMARKLTDLAKQKDASGILLDKEG